MKKRTKIVLNTTILSALSLSAVFPAVYFASHDSQSKSQTTKSTQLLAKTKSKNSALATIQPANNTKNNTYISINNTYNNALASYSTAIINNIDVNPLANLNGFLNALLTASVSNTAFLNKNSINASNVSDAVPIGSYYYNFIMGFGPAIGAFLYYLYTQQEITLNGISLIPYSVNIENSNGTRTSTIQLQLTLHFNNLPNSILNSITSIYKSIFASTSNTNTTNWTIYTNENDWTKNYIVFTTNTTSQLPFFNFTNYTLNPSSGSTKTNQYDVNNLSSLLTQSNTLTTAFNQFFNYNSSQILNIGDFSLFIDPTLKQDSLITYGFGFYNANATNGTNTNVINGSSVTNFSGLALSSNTISVNDTNITINSINVQTSNLLPLLVTINGAIIGASLNTNDGNTIDCEQLKTNNNLYLTQSFLTNLTSSSNPWCNDPAFCNYLTNFLFGNSNPNLSVSSFYVTDTGNNFAITELKIIDTSNYSFVNPFVQQSKSLIANASNTDALSYVSSLDVYTSGSAIQLPSSISISKPLTNSASQTYKDESGINYAYAEYETENPNSALVKTLTLSALTGLTLPYSNVTITNGNSYSNKIYLTVNDKAMVNGASPSSFTNYSEFNYCIYVPGLLTGDANISISITTNNVFTWSSFKYNTTSETGVGGVYIAKGTATYTSASGQAETANIYILLAPSTQVVPSTSPISVTPVSGSSSPFTTTPTKLPLVATGQLAEETVSQLEPSSKTTTTNYLTTSSVTLPFASLIQFRNMLTGLITNTNANTPAVTKWLLETFFPNWFSSNGDLIQSFDTNSGQNLSWANNTNWIYTFIITIINELNNSIGNSTDLTWTAPGLSTRQELMTTNNSRPYTYEFTITCNASLTRTYTSQAKSYNFATILANEESPVFSASNIANTSDLFDNAFNSNLLTNSINLNNLDIASFYNILLNQANASNYTTAVCSYLSLLLDKLYSDNSNEDSFASLINNLIGMSSSLANSHFVVYSFSNDDGVISNISAVFYKGSDVYNLQLTNISFDFAINESSININIANVTNASQWMQYLSNWKNGGALLNNNYTFPSAYFNNISTLSFVTQNYNFNNDSYSVVNGTSTQTKYAFNYDDLTGYLPNSTSNPASSWCTWSSFSSFIETILNQTSLTSNSNIFAGISNLVIADVNFSGISVNSILANLTTWFPNLTSLTIQGSGLAGNVDLNNYSNLQSVNFSNNSLTSLDFSNSSSSKNAIMDALDVSHNQISQINYNSTQNTYQTINLPYNVFNIAYNNISQIGNTNLSTANSKNIYKHNPYIVNLSNNAFTSFDFTNWFNTSLQTLTSGASSILVQNNNLLSVTINSNVVSSSLTLETNGAGVWSFSQTDGTASTRIATLNISNQTTQGYWLFAINKTSLVPLYANAVSGNKAWWTDGFYGIPFANVVNQKDEGGLSGTLGGSSVTVGKQLTTLPTWFHSTTSAGIITSQNYFAYQDDPSGLNELFNGQLANTTISSNANYLLNAFNLKNSTLSLANSNGSSSSAITYNQFITNYNGIIPLNALDVYNIIKNNLNSTNLTFSVLQTIYSQNFNLAGQTLQYYSTSNAPSYITDFLANKQNLQLGTGGSSYIYGIAYPNNSNNTNGIIILAKPGASGYYATSISNDYTASNGVYATITINNVNTHDTLNIRTVLVNDLQDIYSSTSKQVITLTNTSFSNVDEISLNRVWSLNGTSGFYNLASSGILTTLSLNPFSNGVDYALYYDFMHTVYNVSNSKNTLALLLNSNTANISGQINMIIDTWGQTAYRTFENNLYKLLQEEGILQFNQTSSLYGSFANNQFNLSSTFINSNLTLLTSSQQKGSYSYGINATNNNANAQAGTINTPNVTSFYQTSIWANFVNTKINIGTSKKPNYETIGHYLYEQGNWNYEMPSYNNALFTNSTAKQAYNNILNLFGLSNDLTQTAFNQAISNDFPNLILVANASNSINTSNINTLYDNLAKYYNDNTLYTSFVYTQGTITNQYNFYSSNTNSSNTYAYSLDYINVFSNIANTQNYIFKVNMYGPSYFSNSNTSIINPNSLILNGITFNFALTNPKTYTWNQLETNENNNVIAQAVYNNENVIGGGNSSSWIPVQNYALLYQTEHQEFVRNLAVGVVSAILVLSILGLAVYFIVRNNKKSNERRREGNILTAKRRQEYQTELQDVKNDEEWE